MLPIEKIVCPTDFSDPAHEALAVACELAEHFAAELIVLHVTQKLPLAVAATPAAMASATPEHGTFDVAGYQELLTNQAAEQLDQLVAQQVPARIRVRKLVAWGSPATVIVDTAEEQEADMIVIATHGRTGVRRFLFGSVAEKVVRTATRPVLTVQTANSEAE